MKECIVAVATEDGKTLMERHFGDADRFVLFLLSKDGVVPLQEIMNTVEEEDESLHADPEKARGIAGLLKQAGVRVAVSRVFGPNIKRIRKQFVCVITDGPEIPEALRLVAGHFEAIVQEWDKGESRGHLVLRG